MTRPTLRERRPGRAHSTAGGVALIVAVSGALLIAVTISQPRARVPGDVAWAGGVLTIGFAAAAIGGLAAGLALVVGPRSVLPGVAAAGGLVGIGLAVTAVVQILGADGGLGRTVGIGGVAQTGLLGCLLVALGGLAALLAPIPTGS